MEINQTKNVLPRNEELDEEWIDLILSALEMGIATEEIRFFLANATIKCTDLNKDE